MKPSDIKKVITRLVIERENVLLVGSPGVGKTDIVKQIACDVGYDLIISHPVVDSPIDYKGMPMVSGDRADFIPFGHLNDLIHASRPTIYFLDDLGQAPDTVQAAVMQLLLSRELNGKKISDHVRFIAATNQKSDRAAVSAILEPVKSRFITILRLDVDVDDFIKWAEDNSMPQELIAFIKMKPNYLLAFKPTSEIKNSPCPRTIAAAGRLQSFGFERTVFTEVVAGAVGDEMASEYTAFLDVLKDAPMIGEILADPDNCRLPDESNPSLRGIICASLKNKVNASNFDQIIRYTKRMSREYAQFMVTAITSENEDLKNTNAYTKWCIENQDLMK